MQPSHAITRANGLTTEPLHPVDLDLPPGGDLDMREHGFAHDDRPMRSAEVMAAEIPVIGTPIRLGEENSVYRRTIERLYGDMASPASTTGRSNTVRSMDGCIVTGNEDGIEHGAMTVRYARQRPGYVIPSQGDANRIGEACPDPSYDDAGSGAPEDDWPSAPSRS